MEQRGPLLGEGGGFWSHGGADLEGDPPSHLSSRKPRVVGLIPLCGWGVGEARMAAAQMATAIPLALLFSQQRLVAALGTKPPAPSQDTHLGFPLLPQLLAPDTQGP